MASHARSMRPRTGVGVDPGSFDHLAVDAEISVRRARILDSLGVGLVVVKTDGRWPGNDRGSAVTQA